MKILYITTIGGTMILFKSLIKQLIDDGNTVDIATNEKNSPVPEYYRDLGCKIFQISTSRSPFSFGNIKAIRQIRKIACGYDIVHCHTPLAGMATRFACKKLRRKEKIKVVYTAHGFHFYKGAPLLNWLLYYPIEKLCSRWTDCLITINEEDFKIAKTKMKAKDVERVLGVGIDTSKFVGTQIDKNIVREKIGVPNDSIMIISVGELNKNKNHEVVIKALGKIDNNKFHYVIAGVGPLKDDLENLAKKERVNLHLLGFRNDVSDLLKASDINVFPSIREGFGLAAIEGMASGVPTICSKNRGTMTFGKAGKNCLFFSHNDYVTLSKLICLLASNNKLGNNLCQGFRKELPMYDVSSINECIKSIYSKLKAN